MIKENFAAFILSHGRADNVRTYDLLLKSGYTGKIFILIDNEDKTIDEYKKKFGNKVIVFNKKEIADKIDTMDNFEGRKAIVYARNANFQIAKELGIKYFIQLDDDYTGLYYRFNSINEWESKNVYKLDNILNSCLDFLKITKAKSIAFAQGGDFIGGAKGGFGKSLRLKRKCMNTWILDSDNPIDFIGKMNEDFTASIYYGSLGNLFFTLPQISVRQIETQKGGGGMTDIYLDNGTFVKTFYTIMTSPSCIKVSMMGETHRRIHHTTNWYNAVPVILNEQYKKK